MGQENSVQVGLHFENRAALSDSRLNRYNDDRWITNYIETLCEKAVKNTVVFEKDTSASIL